MSGQGERGRPARRRWVAELLVVSVTLGLVLVACGNSGATPTTPGASGSTQGGAATVKSEGGQVTVAVTWDGAGAGPVFRVALDSHSVDLDGYDLRQLAVLRTDLGRETRPTGWDAPKGGHHREGTLTFPPTTADGSPVIGSSTRSIELIIRDVAGVPVRSFRWTP